MLGGTKVGEGSGDHLMSPVGPGQSRGEEGALTPRELLGFEYLETFLSTILKHFVNVMKCIKTYESSPKSFKQFLSSECKLKEDVT